MGILLDLIILAVILVVVLLSAKRGFMRVAVETVGFIAAIFLTFTISTPLAGLTYDKIIEPPIVKSVTATVNESVSDASDSVWEALPGAVKAYSERFGITKEKISDTFSDSSAGQAAADKVAGLSQNILRPAAVRILSLLFGVVVLIILLIAVKFAARFLNKLFSFSIAGKLNRILGGAVGIPKGIIIALLLCLIIELTVPLTENGILIFTEEAMEKSWFFTHIPFDIFK